MDWVFWPPFVAPYTLFLVATVALTVVRAGLLSWHLFGGFRRQRLSIGRVFENSVSADDLARAGLANLVSHEAPPSGRLAELREGPRIEPDAALRTLWAADSRFDYLWRRLAVSVSSTWSLMRLTLLATAFITAYGFFPTWESSAFGDRDSNEPLALTALYQAGEWIMARLALGFAVAGVLCVVAMVFDGVLQRRLASWKYFYATARDALSGGQPFE